MSVTLREAQFALIIMDEGKINEWMWNSQNSWRNHVYDTNKLINVKLSKSERWS